MIKVELNMGNVQFPVETEVNGANRRFSIKAAIEFRNKLNQAITKHEKINNNLNQRRLDNA